MATARGYKEIVRVLLVLPKLDVNYVKRYDCTNMGHKIPASRSGEIQEDSRNVTDTVDIMLSDDPFTGRLILLNQLFYLPGFPYIRVEVSEDMSIG